MNGFYSLWDVDVGTSLGTYESEDEALTIAEALIQVNGDAYADSLDLGRYDADEEGQSIATGEALLKRVREWRAQRLAAAGAGD